MNCVFSKIVDIKNFLVLSIVYFNDDILIVFFVISFEGFHG